MERIAARREYRADGWLHRRIGRGWRGFYTAGVSNRRIVDLLRSLARLLEIHRADDGGEHSRRPVRLAGAPRAGGRSHAAVSRIRRGVADSQSRAAGCAGRAISLLEYRIGRAGADPGRNAAVRGGQELLRAHRPVGQELRQAGTAGKPEPDQHRRDYQHRRAHHQSRVHGSGLRDRAVAGRVAVFRRSAGVGRSGSAVHVFSGSAAAAISSPRRERRRLGGQRRRGVALHRAAHRRGRNAGGLSLHVVPHGQEPDVEPGPRAQRSSPRRSAA